MTIIKAMGRVVSPVRIENLSDSACTITCDALVDTGSAHLMLPSQWKEKLGNMQLRREEDLELGDHSRIKGEVCGPVKIQIEGFPAISGEVLFVASQPSDSGYEPLIGYLVLEASQAAVDMVGHRLINVKKVDLK